MATADEKIITVEGKSIRITHPEKVLFKPSGITKMELIDYYLRMAPYILAHNRGRPVVFVRYPHGAPGYAFFQKNVPPSAPEWIETHEMGKYKLTRYVIINGVAELVWLVQLHALEFHVMPLKKPHWTTPDLMVFDLDPPEGAGFADIKDFALACRPVLEEAGYRVYVKTSGKKGLHLVCPIRPHYTVDQVLEAARDLAQRIIDRTGHATLDVRKDKRQGKFLIDIYRNRAYQTFSMAYGTRATGVASVSLPVTWKQLAAIDDPLAFTIRNVPAWVTQNGDAWHDMESRATDLHTVETGN